MADNDFLAILRPISKSKVPDAAPCPLTLPNVPLHIIQRGNNRQACFFADEDARFYLDWLREHAGKTGCRIHAYVLMTNPLKGELRGRWSVVVNGNWRVTFEFQEGNAYVLDYEDYH